MADNDYSLKKLREGFRAGGVFYTPEKQARMLMDLLPSDITEIYDPTCGRGGLLRYYPDSVIKYGEEIDPQAAADCQQILGKNSQIICTDVLTAPAFTDKRFKAIIANPPFGVKWNPPTPLEKSQDWRYKDAPDLPTKQRADWAFLLHIMGMLADDGTAAVIDSPGVLYRSQPREIAIRRWFCEQGWIEKVIEIPPKTFVDTNISTVILVLKKHRDGTDIEYIKENGDVTTITLEQLKDNDYVVKAGMYEPIQIPYSNQTPEEIDQQLLSMETEIRKMYVSQLKNSLANSYNILNIRAVGSDKCNDKLRDTFSNTLDELEDIIRDYRSRLASESTKAR